MQRKFLQISRMKLTLFYLLRYVLFLIILKISLKITTKAILKKMSVGGNPSCCNLEALLEKFFQVFLRFTEIYFNDTH